MWRLVLLIWKRGLSLFASESRGPNNGHVICINFRSEQLKCVEKNREYLFVEVLLGWSQKPVTCLRQTSTENNCLRTGDRNGRCKSAGKILSGNVKYLRSKLITFFGVLPNQLCC